MQAEQRGLPATVGGAGNQPESGDELRDTRMLNGAPAL